ncbi:hypothetical protein [Lactiplantibacillus pingfangensis]|uniref:hypothetical protein n=1 Tax=Lactiplantibacillus pingfangensis TaxID=2559915 RepID=UPI0010F5F440|nr:hypothetical protein [Lactiplantibacillus pingfangensis]
MKWQSIWRHTRTVGQTLLIYFLLIQGPYDLWIAKVGYRLVSYLTTIVGITILFVIVELSYNYLRQHWQNRH